MAREEPNQFVAVARVIKPQGRRGEVLAETLTDFPTRFQERGRLFLENIGPTPEPVLLEKVWPHRGGMVLKFAGVDSIEQAQRLRGRLVLIPREERAPLPANHYYVGDLQGCRVVRETHGAQMEVGTVTEVERTGGVGLLHVATPSGDVLVPLAQAICTRIDAEKKIIVIDPPEDLLELNL